VSIDLKELAKRVAPQETVLFLGAGASVPSGAPTAADLAEAISTEFEIDLSDYSLSEIASIASEKNSRKSVVDFVNSKIDRLHPTLGLRTIPLFDWRRIYTTNYDKLIERAYRDSQAELQVMSSNF